jgi:hypothetical protein
VPDGRAGCKEVAKAARHAVPSRARRGAPRLHRRGASAQALSRRLPRACRKRRGKRSPGAKGARIGPDRALPGAGLGHGNAMALPWISSYLWRRRPNGTEHSLLDRHPAATPHHRPRQNPPEMPRCNVPIRKSTQAERPRWTTTDQGSRPSPKRQVRVTPFPAGFHDVAEVASTAPAPERHRRDDRPAWEPSLATMADVKIVP